MNQLFLNFPYFFQDLKSTILFFLFHGLVEVVLVNLFISTTKESVWIKLTLFFCENFYWKRLHATLEPILKNYKTKNKQNKLVIQNKRIWNERKARSNRCLTSKMSSANVNDVSAPPEKKTLHCTQILVPYTKSR